MIRYDLSKWEYRKELECLLFFGQKVAELLFDYSLASYKFPTLYSASLCEEAVRTIEMIEKETISEKSIIPIKEELCKRLPKDIVVNYILGNSLQDYMKEFDLNNLHEFKINLELLYNKIRPDIYIKTTQDILEQLIIENKQKEKISNLATNYIAALIDYGYSQSYINTQSSIFFSLRGDLPKIKEPQIIRDFFKTFSLEYNKYEIIISANGLYKNIENALNEFKIEVISDLPNNKNLSFKEQSYLKRKEKSSILLKCNNIIALDSRSAKEIAENKLNTLAKLFNFFHHKDFPDFSNYALIYKDEVFLHTIGPKTSAMHKCQDFYPNIAGEKLNNLIHNFGIDSTSFYKIDKAIELHRESIKSNVVENQLLQNWIAFETLLVGYSKKSKIEQVFEGILPALKLTYLASIIKELLDDLLHWNKWKTENFLSAINGDSLIEKLTQILCIESNKPVRDKFYENLENFPLLKNRILVLKNIFSTPETTLDFLIEHEQRVTWQIKRIYRTRNQIVHLGYVSDFTSYLVENSHNYLDIFINQIIHLVIENRQIISLEQGLKEIKIRQQKHEKLLLSNKNSEFTADNYKELIFGTGTFANTWFKSLG